MSEQPRGSAHNDSVSAWSRLEASPYYQTAFYLGLVYPGLLCLLGLPGNLFSALYIRRKWPVAPPQVYMTSLCVVDSLALMHKLLMIHLPTLHVHMTPRGCQYLQFVLQWASQMSSWLLVFLSVERAVVVRFPFSRRTCFSTRQAVSSVALTALVLALLNAHCFLTVTSEPRAHVCVHHQDFRHLVRAVWYYIEALVLAFLPCLCLLLSNLAMMLSLYSGLRHSRGTHTCSYSNSNRNSNKKTNSSNSNKKNSSNNWPPQRRKDPHPTTTLSHPPPPPATTPTSRRPLSHHCVGGGRRCVGGGRGYRLSHVTRSTVLASLLFVFFTAPYSVLMLCRAPSNRPPDPEERARVLLVATIAYCLRDASHAVNFALYIVRVRRRELCPVHRE